MTNTDGHPGYARNCRFRFDPYLRLFEEPTPDAP